MRRNKKEEVEDKKCEIGGKDKKEETGGKDEREET